MFSLNLPDGSPRSTNKGIIGPTIVPACTRIDRNPVFTVRPARLFDGGRVTPRILARRRRRRQQRRRSGSGGSSSSNATTLCSTKVVLHCKLVRPRVHRRATIVDSSCVLGDLVTTVATDGRYKPPREILAAWPQATTTSAEMTSTTSS